MKGVIIKVDTILMSKDDQDRLHDDIRRDLQRDGFTILDTRFTIIPVDNGKDDN